MALSALRLRRPLCLASAALGRAIAAPPTFVPRCTASYPGPVSAPGEFGRVPAPLWIVQSASFRSTSSPTYGDDDKISPDTILFEGCDYNHWLITMEFPKDPSPTKEEMVQAYVDTCAKGLGCSVEEAMKKIYACSTTVYVGFQAIMTEEESEKFRGLPGVVFILPDSYIDPANKEYGGDKYINGTIIPRPPPQTFSRGGFRRDRPRRDYSTPHVNSNDSQYASRDERGFTPQQNYGPPGQNDGRGFTPQQNYGPPGQNDGRGFGTPGQNDGRGFVPPAQNDSRFGPSRQNEGSGYVQPGQGDGRSYAQTGVNDGRGMGPPGQFDSRWNVPEGHGMRGEGGYGQGERRGPMSPPGYQGGDWRGSPTQGPPSYNQAERGNFNPQGPPAFSGNNRSMNSPSGEDYRQWGPGHNQNYAVPGQGQRFDRDFQQNGPSGYGQNYGSPSESPQFNEQ